MLLKAFACISRVFYILFYMRGGLTKLRLKDRINGRS